MEFGLIAADTSRTRAYLHALNAAGISIDWCLKLGIKQKAHGQVDSKENTPVISQDDYRRWPEASFDPKADLEDLLQRSCKQVTYANDHDINCDSVVRAIKNSPCDILIYSGYGGYLLREGILSTGRKFLHVHGGYLPDYKGSTTNYYSIIDREKIGASSIFLTSEIDGGPILVREEFDLPLDLEHMDHIFDNAARARVLVKTLIDLEGLDGHHSVSAKPLPGGNTYYIVHPLLKHLAILHH